MPPLALIVNKPLLFLMTRQREFGMLIVVRLWLFYLVMVHHAAFNPQDSTQVLTTSDDHTARLWKIFSIHELTNLARKRVFRKLTLEERKQFFLEY